MNITRTFERRLVYALGIWQIIDGLITILYYGVYQQSQMMSGENLASEQIYVLENTFGSVFNFINIFGLLLIGLGLINLVVAKNYVKDTIVNYKVGIWLVGVGLFSYFIMDILSVIISISAGVIYLAKNKSIQAANS